MRVITGSAKGHGLKNPGHLKLRPTPSRVKEALFSSLAARVPGARVLELFAGTGAFAIETLSRGAASATLVEKDPRAAKLIEDNLRKTHLTEKARLLRTDIRQALEWLHKDKATFDLIFADPPYNKGGRPSLEEKEVHPPPRKPPVEAFSWLNELLTSEHLPALLAPEGVLLIEFFKKETPTNSPNFKLSREFRFGDTLVGLWMRIPK